MVGLGRNGGTAACLIEVNGASIGPLHARLVGVMM